MIRRTTFRGQNEKDRYAHLKKFQKAIYKVKILVFLSEKENKEDERKDP